MKFEVKTHNDDYSRPLVPFFYFSAIITLIIILSSISLRLGNISRNYKVNYYCKLLLIEKTSINFKRLSRITKVNNRQKIWDLCREIIK